MNKFLILAFKALTLTIFTLLLPLIKHFYFIIDGFLDYLVVLYIEFLDYVKINLDFILTYLLVDVKNINNYTGIDQNESIIDTPQHNYSNMDLNYNLSIVGWIVLGLGLGIALSYIGYTTGVITLEDTRLTEVIEQLELTNINFANYMSHDQVKYRDIIRPIMVLQRQMAIQEHNTNDIANVIQHLNDYMTLPDYE